MEKIGGISKDDGTLKQCECEECPYKCTSMFHLIERMSDISSEAPRIATSYAFVVAV